MPPDPKAAPALERVNVGRQRIDAPVNRAPKLNRHRLRLLTGAPGVVLGEGHPTTQALARAITTWEPGDVTRARMGCPS